jgi:DNA-binding transcriptional ArsR family regulator
MPRGAYFLLVTVNATIEVIAEPTRRHILDVLRAGEQPVQALVERLAISQPSASKHLRVLRDAGLVRVRPDGQRRLYSVCCEPLVELDTWLEPYRQMWCQSLDKLEQHLSETTRQGKKKS